MTSVVRFPWQRREVLRAIAELADVEAQVPDWFRALGPLDHIFTLLFDSFGAFDNPEYWVPDQYFAGRELEAISRLADVFRKVRDSTPGGLYWTTFAAQNPLWPTIAPLASDVVVQMTLNWGFEEPAGMTESTPDD